MKQNNKILLYGLLASILLILLCLYTHQDEFMNEKKDVVLESEKKDKPVNANIVSVKKEVEKNDSVAKVEPKEKEPEKKEVPVSNPTIEKQIENNQSKISEENSGVEDNGSSPAIKRTIFKNKEDIKFKEHIKLLENNKSKIEVVDKNLPAEDSKPLIDNEKSKKKEEEKSTQKDEKQEKVSSDSKASKKHSSKSIASIQKSISKITNCNISFYKSKSKITDKSKITLNKVIKILKTMPNAKIVVKGYTDASGKKQINLWISQERAKSVRRYLGKHGIPLKNIVAKGFGESELLYGDKPYSELNRRVEIEIKRK